MRKATTRTTAARDPPLTVGVYPETGQVGNRKGKIVVTGPQVRLHIPACQLIHCFNEMLRFRRHDPGFAHGADTSRIFFAYRTAGYDKKIRSAIFHGLF